MKETFTLNNKKTKVEKKFRKLTDKKKFHVPHTFETKKKKSKKTRARKERKLKQGGDDM